jgi:hypothetical protein
MDVRCDVGARNSDRKCGAVTDLEASWHVFDPFLFLAFRLAEPKVDSDRVGFEGYRRPGVTIDENSTHVSILLSSNARAMFTNLIFDAVGTRQDG